MLVLFHNRYSLNKIFCILVSGLLFLPVSALLIYNFVELKSLMSSFYLLVVFSVLMIIINQLTNRIDRLYNIAVGSNEIKEKKGKVLADTSGKRASKLVQTAKTAQSAQAQE